MRPRVVRADNPSPMTLDGTCTYLVGVRRPVVIDPGPDDARHRERILEALGGRAPVAVLLTHRHPDHAGGARALSVATGASVLDAEALSDGQEVETDAGALAAVSTPGHTPDHLCFHWAAGEAAFVGDLLMGEGDTTLVAPPEGDLAAYLASLDRVGALRARVLYPAHGPPLEDPVEAVERFRAHRFSRIRQVEKALSRLGPVSPAGLREAVYGAELDPRLAAAAESSLQAILRFMEGEGRASSLPGGRYARTISAEPEESR